MRWRFVDKVTSLEPWRRITGRKAVSLEEYYLLERTGREGVLPESLVVECCVELVRWLVAASSSFALMSALEEIDGFTFARTAAIGELLRLDAEVAEKDDSIISTECQVTVNGTAIASGRLRSCLLPLGVGFEPGELEGLWRELYGPA